MVLEISHLYLVSNKRQGRQLLAYLGAPKELYEKTPTADLEDDKPQLPDEDALGVTYEAIDNYLEGKPVTPEEQKVIENHYIRNAHKRELAYTRARGQNPNLIFSSNV